jgi:hypothetical protein
MRVHAHVRGWIQRDMLQPGDPQIQEVLGEARHIGDRWLLGQAYATLARMLMLSGHHEQAQSAVEDANACFTKLDHSYMLGTVANIRSNLAWFDADIDLSLSWMRERLARDEATGNVAGAFYNCAFQSVLLIRLGDAAAGERLLAQAQALATPELRAENLPIYIIELLLLRGDVATARARIDAMRRAPRSIHLYGGLNDTDMVESLLHLMTGELAAAEHGYRALREGAQAARNFATIEWSIRLGDIASHSGDPSAAQEHFDAAIGLARRIAHLPLAANSSAGYARALARLGSPHDGCRQLALALPIFRRMRLRDDLAYGGETAALLCAACGAPAQAVRLLAAAAALREQVGIPLWPVERPEIERCLAESRAALDDAAFDAAWQAGRALTWEQAADDALAWLTAQERPPQHEGVGAG